MTQKNKSMLVLLSLCLAGCFGGGVSADKVGGSGSSDALVQAIPYEVMRNALITSFNLTTASPAIKILDDNANVFGKPTAAGSPRNTALSISRLRLHAQICDAAAKEALTTAPDQFFDSGSLSPDKAYLKIVGRPIIPAKKAAADALIAQEGYTTESQKKHALLFAFCNQLDNQVQ